MGQGCGTDEEVTLGNIRGVGDEADAEIYLRDCMMGTVCVAVCVTVHPCSLLYLAVHPQALQTPTKCKDLQLFSGSITHLPELLLMPS